MAAKPTYILEDMLGVRRLREDAATKQLVKQKEIVAMAERCLEQRQQDLDSYGVWRVRRESELFDEIIDHTISSHDLEDLRFRVQKLRDKESTLRSEVIEAEEKLKTATQDLERARQRYSEAYRERGKLDEHRAAWMQEASREQELREEKEAEDFKVRSELLICEE